MVPSALSLPSMTASVGSLPSTFGGFDGGRPEAPGDLLLDPTAAHVLSDGDNAGDYGGGGDDDSSGWPPHLLEEGPNEVELIGVRGGADLGRCASRPRPVSEIPVRPPSAAAAAW